MATALLSELEAINAMFATIGEAPINTLTGQHPHTTIARSVLALELKEFLSKGWSFNTEEKISYTVDASNNIILPTNILKFELWDTSLKFKLTTRYNSTTGTQMLYDIENQTFDLSTRGLTSVKINQTLALDFTDIPFTAQNYVTKAAARKFANKVLSSNVVYRLSKEEEFDAYNAFLTEELDRANYNMLTDNSGYAYIRGAAWV